jgi:anti-anti-sigma regulatory factor
MELPSRFAAGEHACLAYADDRELCDVAADFVAEGLDAGQRVLCVADAQIELLRRALGPLEPDRLVKEGALELHAVEDVYGDGPVDPAAQLRTFADAVTRAEADGFSGLRVMADNTPLLFDRPDARRDYLRWESVCEPFIASRQLIGMCCFDKRRVPHELMDDLASVHRRTHGLERDARFRLIPVPDRVTLRGDVDWYDAKRLGRLLESTVAAGEDVELDLGEVAYLDHHALFAITAARDRLRAHGKTLVLTEVPSVTRRLAERLGIEL